MGEIDTFLAGISLAPLLLEDNKLRVLRLLDHGGRHHGRLPPTRSIAGTHRMLPQKGRPKRGERVRTDHENLCS